MMLRRHWLAGAAAATTLGVLSRSRPAEAQWGAWPSSLASLRLPAARRAHRILEVFFYGGLCPWDTFYCVPQWGAGESRFLHALDVAGAFEACGGSGYLARPFAEDAAGTLVHLGPWTHPLWSRPDLLARMRVVVTRHDQLPHETAIPLALTGARLGSPQLAGTGSAVQRHFAAAAERAAPYAYVIHPGAEWSGQNLSASTATGRHPAQARPWDLAIDDGARLAELLARPTTAGRREAHDALLRLYTERYTERLRGQQTGTLARSPALDTWRSMLAAQRHSPAMASMVGPELFALPLARECGHSRISVPQTTARLATHLLRAEQDARYVLWVDSGLSPSPDGGHDSHREHLAHASVNYVHTLRTLAERINAPGEHAPDKLDLDDTLVVITTEFGRAPHRQDEDGGLNHWPQGYVSVLMGGPVDEGGAGIFGSIDSQTAQARSFITPAELRAGLLDALGIYPFDAAAFGLGDLQGGPADDATAIAGLRRAVLGVEA
ncbi:MAG: DUF1501 domain-containing protein [Myxococcota bacterium]